jgi:hypothetical protein
MFQRRKTHKDQMTTMRAPRFLLVFAAVLSIAGAALHAAAFSKALPIIAASGLPPFYSSSFKGLWLADSATLTVLAAICMVITARLQMATRWLLILLAFIPLGYGDSAVHISWKLFCGASFIGDCGSCDSRRRAPTPVRGGWRAAITSTTLLFPLPVEPGLCQQTLG